MMSMMDEIKKGVQLKKVITVEKTGLDYVKHKLSITKSSIPENKTEVKGDFFSELKKVQLKKINK